MQTKVKYFREKEGMTQEELSRKSGISRTTISNLENGILDNTTNTTMIKIAEALNHKVNEIFLL